MKNSLPLQLESLPLLR